MRYHPPIYVLCVSSHFWPFTKVNFVLTILQKSWDSVRPPPPGWDKIPSLSKEINFRLPLRLRTRRWKPRIFLLQLKGEYICQNIYFLSPISLNSERFVLTITQLSVVVVVKELPGQRVRHIGDDCLVVGHAGDSKNWKYAKQCQTFSSTTFTQLKNTLTFFDNIWSCS